MVNEAVETVKELLVIDVRPDALAVIVFVPIVVVARLENVTVPFPPAVPMFNEVVPVTEPVPEAMAVVTFKVTKFPEVLVVGLLYWS